MSIIYNGTEIPEDEDDGAVPLDYNGQPVTKVVYADENGSRTVWELYCTDCDCDSCGDVCAEDYCDDDPCGDCNFDGCDDDGTCDFSCSDCDCTDNCEDC